MGISLKLVSVHPRTRLQKSLLLKSEIAVTMATIHLLTLIWLFLFIPQVTNLHTKNVGGGGLKIFISNFAPLSQKTALNMFQRKKSIFTQAMQHVQHYQSLCNGNSTLHHYYFASSLKTNNINMFSAHIPTH